MPGTTTQVKFTIDASIVSTFKARCADSDVSMTSVIQKFMITCQPAKKIQQRAITRPLRKSTVLEVIELLSTLTELEAEYRDRIPGQFEQRYEAADHACDKLSEAIGCLEDAY
jgi:hypothetical protein